MTYTCAICLLTRELVSDQYPAMTIWRGTAYCETHLEEAASGTDVEPELIDGYRAP